MDKTDSQAPFQGPSSSAPAGDRGFRVKAVAGLLALLAGIFGAHRLYLGGRLWWLYPAVALPALGWAARFEEWYREPAFFVAGAVGLVGLVEAIVFCLTPDERWDARWNPGASRRSSSGWPAVLIAIAALMLGATLMMSVLAIALEGYFSSHPNLPR
jgi:hypothetical protein